MSLQNLAVRHVPARPSLGGHVERTDKKDLQSFSTVPSFRKVNPPPLYGCAINKRLRLGSALVPVMTLYLIPFIN